MARTVLIVEDDAPTLKVLNDRIAQEGYKVLAAKDGKEGLSQATTEHPDLILLDLLLPKIDGLTMLKQLRKDDWGRKVPVLVLTNLSETASVYESISLNVSGYLVKTDWSLDDLMKKIRSKLPA